MFRSALPSRTAARRTFIGSMPRSLQSDESPTGRTCGCRSISCPRCSANEPDQHDAIPGSLHWKFKLIRSVRAWHEPSAHPVRSLHATPRSSASITPARRDTACVVSSQQNLNAPQLKSEPHADTLWPCHRAKPSSVHSQIVSLRCSDLLAGKPAWSASLCFQLSISGLGDSTSLRNRSRRSNT